MPKESENQPVSELAKAFLADQEVVVKPQYPIPTPVEKDPVEPEAKPETKPDAEKPAEKTDEPKAEEKPKTEEPKVEAPAAGDDKPKADDAKPDEKQIKVESPKEEAPWSKEIRELTDELRSNRTTPPPAAPPQSEELTPNEVRRLEVFQHMEATNPANKGLVNQVKTYFKELRTYRAKWEAEHPGEEFDSESDDHTPFMDRNLPKYNEDEFDDARVDLRAQKVIEQREQKREVEAAKKTLPDRINKATNDAIGEMVASASPELAKALLDKGPKGMEEVDPELTERLDSVVPELRRWVSELEKIFDPRLNYTPVPGNALHEEIEQFVIDTEQFIQKLPPDKRVQNGKQFATIGQYYQMPEAKRQGFWCLEAKQIEVLKARNLAASAKQRAEKARQRSAATKESERKPVSKEEPKTTTEPKAAQDKPPVPGSGSDVGLLNPGSTSGSSAKTLGQLIVNSVE